MNINPAIYEQLTEKTAKRTYQVYDKYKKRNQTYVITVKYGFDTDFDKRNNQVPHFHITGDIQTIRGRDVSGGCIHDEIAKYFPRLRPLIRWHGAEFPGVPMHYASNAAHWANQMSGISQWEQRSYDPNPESAFKNTVIYGIHEDDPALLALIESYRADWQSDYVKALLRDELKRALTWKLAGRMETMARMFLEDMRSFELWSDPEGLIEDAPAPVTVESDPVEIVTFDQAHGITAFVGAVDRNPNMHGVNNDDMDHWEVTFRMGDKDDPKTFTSYYSIGSGHNGRRPTTWEVLENLAEECRTAEQYKDYREFAREFGYENRLEGQSVLNTMRENRRALKTFLGETLYSELLETLEV